MILSLQVGLRLTRDGKKLAMLRSKLEHKVLLIIIIALICGLGLPVVISIKRESANLADQYRVRSLLFGDTLMTGFRNVMLSGRAGYVKQLIAEARAEFRDYGQLLLFDNMGKQIFAERGEIVSHEKMPPVESDVFRAKVFWLGKRSLTKDSRLKIKLNSLIPDKDN